MSGLMDTMGPTAAAVAALSAADELPRLLTNQERFDLPTLGQRREAALTYALWDAYNTVRLERPEQYEATLPHAKAMIYWLGNRGWHLHQQETRDDHWEVARLRRRVRRLCWALAGVSLMLTVASAALLLR